MGTIRIEATSKGHDRFKARVKIRGKDIRKSFDNEQEAQAWIDTMEATKRPPRPRSPKPADYTNTDRERWEPESFAKAFGIPIVAIKYMLYYKNINGLAACGATTKLSKHSGKQIILKSPMLAWLREKNLWRECEGSCPSSYTSKSKDNSRMELYEQAESIPNSDDSTDDQADGTEAYVDYRAQD